MDLEKEVTLSSELQVSSWIGGAGIDGAWKQRRKAMLDLRLASLASTANVGCSGLA
jgi:hypothetical protein